MSLADVRREYQGEPLSEITAEADPFRQFDRWLTQAREVEAEPTAMALATAPPGGHPSVRMVLLKGIEDGTLEFFTNYESQKAHEMAASGWASAVFHWATLNRQVRVSGPVARVSAAESDAYFRSRPVESRWSVHASHQGEVVAGREVLDAAYEAARQTYGEDVPRPEWWGGYRVRPVEFEFWQGRPGRLHDRVRYVRLDDGTWRRERLAP